MLMLFRRLEFRTLSYDYDDRMKFMTDTHLARRAVHTQPVQEISDVWLLLCARKLSEPKHLLAKA